MSVFGAIDRPNPKGLKIGDRLADNDPRSVGRVVVITRLVAPGGKWHAEYKGAHRISRVNFDRIYTDGKPHSQGYNLLR